MNGLVLFGVEQLDEQLVEPAVDAPVHVPQIVAGVVFAEIHELEPLTDLPRAVAAPVEPRRAFAGHELEPGQTLQKGLIDEGVGGIGHGVFSGE